MVDILATDLGKAGQQVTALPRTEVRGRAHTSVATIHRSRRKQESSEGEGAHVPVAVEGELEPGSRDAVKSPAGIGG